MDSGAHKLLESAVQRTLHAHAFSRSSSQASSVLTDLLSRYMTLLTSTCAKYAQHAGRTGLSVSDAMGALNELGVSIEELSDYCATEGRELSRYALYTARRVEDLHEFRSQLADGLRQDHDDAIPLEYARCPTPLLEELEDDDDEDASGEEDESETEIQSRLDMPHATSDMDVDSSPVLTGIISRKRPPLRQNTPPLPLSPISNPSSPQRKRARASHWEPPEYIPDFLPPFPNLSDDRPSSPAFEHAPAPHILPVMPPPTQIPETTVPEKPSLTLSQSLTTAAASDILVQVPYSQSSLSSVPEWHLPSGPPPPPPARQNRLPTPQIEPTLISAYHHILTHPPPPELPPLNPSRHKVAMALIQLAQSNPRWNPADSLFGSVGPCAPRVATIGPSYPIAIGDTPGVGDQKGKGEGQDKDLKLPTTISRPVSGTERIAPFISQQTSRIPDLARHILPSSILARTSRLAHPPVLHRGSRPLIYGPGIPAPWNANAVSSGTDPVPPTPMASKPKDAPPPNGSSSKDSPVKPVLPDARLFATWDYEPKDFKVPLAPVVRSRNRMGSMQASGSGLISLPVSSRTKGVK
ncbi:hypothetical protein CVT25_013088 [Psilocybe cyanescens]|uniref:Bromodomain associated domain-containing protein n=1 Tax=Psilocybe cyanescens TaxID=93625 RepID=A0A409XHN3_PSICY|nr:hypothetical protein CVT25_013088 [Psilocybe cyanescens]